MSIPKYDEMYREFLEVLADGESHTTSEVRKLLTKKFSLTEDELNEMIPSGRQPIFYNRVGWTMTYLKKAGLIASPKRGEYKITENGLKLLKSRNEINNDVLMEYKSFVSFLNQKNKNEDPSTKKEKPIDDGQTPLESIENAIKTINSNLADKLLEEIGNQSADFFEELVVKLLLKMGYGKDDYSGYKTRSTGDEGIDGVITEDKLGFSKIYIQAKKWNSETSIGRPEIQKFIGAMVGQGADKGLFITTAKFSISAIDLAKKYLASKIVLVDGNKLTDLMIEFNLGVTTRLTYSVKDVDIDFFTEELD